eukprot:1544079-Lingulodinium_polyedra.AAC.1
MGKRPTPTSTTGSLLWWAASGWTRAPWQPPLWGMGNRWAGRPATLPGTYLGTAPGKCTERLATRPHTPG